MYIDTIFLFTYFACILFKLIDSIKYVDSFSNFKIKHLFIARFTVIFIV